jgi:hypothetical protein
MNIRRVVDDIDSLPELINQLQEITAELQEWHKAGLDLEDPVYDGIVLVFTEDSDIATRCDMIEDRVDKDDDDLDEHLECVGGCPCCNSAAQDPDVNTSTEEEKQLQAELEARLLAIGGERVVRPLGNPGSVNLLVDLLLSRGQRYDLPIRKHRGRRNHCHTNSAELWGRDSECCRLVTGYALSDDGLWRHHSWVVDDKHVHETTVERDVYYGVELTREESLRCWVENYLAQEFPGPLQLMAALGNKKGISSQVDHDTRRVYAQ